MNAIPPSFPPAGSAGAGLASGSPGIVAMQWAALAEAADLVATLAGVEPRFDPDERGGFAALIASAEAWRRERAERGVADLAAIMEPGLAALLEINARGADPRPAALALSREFTAARTAILAVLAPAGAV
jgi:hypothetical protein